MPSCCAFGCSNRDSKGFLMKRFPSDPERRKLWETKVKRNNWKTKDSSYLREATEAQETNYAITTSSSSSSCATSPGILLQMKRKELKERIQAYNKCTQIAIWSLINNAIAFPNPYELEIFKALYTIRDAIVANHEERQSGELCHEDLENLKTWELKYPNGTSGRLTEAGVSSANNLGRAYVSFYKEIFRDPYLEEVLVGTSNKLKARETADAFIAGMLKNGLNASIVDVGQYPLLLPEVDCAAWTENQLGAEVHRERDLFRSRPEVKAMVTQVSRRLGFPINLHYEMIHDMYIMCKFDNSIYLVSPWCAAFTEKHLKVLEYDEDIESYYKTGYGNELTPKMACPMVQDLMEKFQNISQNLTVPTASLYFVDATTIRLVLTRLGAARDAQILQASKMKEMENRQWRMAYLTPLQANLAVVLYRCTLGEEYKMMFYLNDNLIDYAGCKVGLCDWSYIYDRFRDIIDPSYCNLSFCDDTSSAPISLPTQFLLTIISIRIIFGSQYLQKFFLQL